MGDLIVGTSGFTYRHWRGLFYPSSVPQRQWLEYYATKFSAVELNVTFYRLPPLATFEAWRRRVPEGFRFVVKGSQTITHYRRLLNAAEPVERLLRAASGLGPHLDCVLWQLPPRMKADPERLRSFGELVTETVARVVPGRELRQAFEFRDSSWFTADVRQVLVGMNAAVVVAQPGAAPALAQPTADFAYLRFHHGLLPGGGFSDSELDPFAEAARSWLARGTDVYALFNNDGGGWAPRNAVRFEEMAAPALANATKSQ